MKTSLSANVQRCAQAFADAFPYADEVGEVVRDVMLEAWPDFWELVAACHVWSDIPGDGLHERGDRGRYCVRCMTHEDASQAEAPCPGTYNPHTDKWEAWTP